MKKGDPLQAARLAGIMAAKQTSALIPLCHPLPIAGVQVELTPTPRGYDIEARVRTTAQTGVEMEALTAVAVAALTVYDMVKAVDKAMVIGDIRLMKKTGGKSGEYTGKVRFEDFRRFKISDFEQIVRSSAGNLKSEILNLKSQVHEHRHRRHQSGGRLDAAARATSTRSGATSRSTPSSKPGIARRSGGCSSNPTPPSRPFSTKTSPARWRACGGCRRRRLASRTCSRPSWSQAPSS